MATTYNNCQMGIVDASGNVSVIYPQTTASLVNCIRAKYGGSSYASDVQNALDNLSSALGKVTQTATNTTNSDYEVLFSGTADNTTRAEGTRKSANFIFNPSTNTIEVPKANIGTGGIYTQIKDGTVYPASSGSVASGNNAVVTGDAIMSFLYSNSYPWIWKKNLNYRDYTDYKAAIKANWDELFPIEGNYIGTFITQGGSPHLYLCSYYTQNEAIMILGHYGGVVQCLYTYDKGNTWV